MPRSLALLDIGHILIVSLIPQTDTSQILFSCPWEKREFRSRVPSYSITRRFPFQASGCRSFDQSDLHAA